jgi:hypothetical protein
MKEPSSGVAWGNWLVSKTSGLLDARLSRRSFIARTTLLGSAVAASGVAVAGCNTPPYQSITGCPPGSACADGYTEFCCVINNGINACPPGTLPAGWWRADGSIYCGGGSRYYIDCNEVCCGPGLNNGFCAGCSPCRCAVDCNTRKVHCNYFRYGQCNTGVAFVGPIGCRMVSCTPPYALNIGCDPSGAVDNSTANHNANCAAYLPPPPPPAAVLPASASAALVSGTPTVIGRGLDGSAYANTFDGTTWTGWVGLGGAMASGIVLAAQGSTLWAFVKSGDRGIWAQARSASGAWGGWAPLGGQFTSDPAAAVDTAGTVRVFGRGTDNAIWTEARTGGAWNGWQSLGGQFTSDPAVAPDASGNVWVFARGTDNGMWVQATNGGSFPGWVPLGGQFTSDPAAAVDTAGTVRVFARGTDNAMWAQAPGHGWQSLGGQFTSDPSAVPDASGKVWVFARGTDNAMWTQAASGGAFPGWQSLGGVIGADPASAADSTVWLFALGLDHSMYTRHFVAGSWTDWQPLGGAFAPVRGAT